MRSQRVRHDWATKQQQQSLSGLIQELEPSGLSGVRWGSKAAGTQMLEAGDGEEPSRPIVGQWKSCHTRHHISKMALLECNSTCLDSFTFTISYSACATCLSSELFRHSPWKKNYDKARKSTKKQRHHLLTKVHIAKAMVFPSSCVWMWELDHKEGWVPKNWCFQTVVLKKTLESSLDSKEIKPVNPKGNQSWIFTRRTDAEAETPIFWLLDAKSQLIGKVSDAGKDWGQEENRMTENEMVGWHHCLSGHECEQYLGDCEGQRSLACCSPWSHKESDTI